MTLKTKGLKAQAKKMAPPTRKEFDALKTAFETKLTEVQTSLAQAEQRATAAETRATSLASSAAPSQVDVEQIKKSVITETVDRLKTIVVERVDKKLKELGVTREDFNAHVTNFDSLVEQAVSKKGLEKTMEEITPQLEFVELMMTKVAGYSRVLESLETMDAKDLLPSATEAFVDVGPENAITALKAIKVSSESDELTERADTVLKNLQTVLSAALPELMDEAVSHEDADDRFEAVDDLTDSYETSDVINELRKIAAGSDPEKAKNAQELLNGIETDE
jgi:hypothetical protein